MSLVAYSVDGGNHLTAEVRFLVVLRSGGFEIGRLRVKGGVGLC